VFRFQNSVLHSLQVELPPISTTSDELELRLNEFYERARLPLGRLELMTGIKERRFWNKGQRPSAGAILAGLKSIKESQIKAQAIEALAFCSVSRDFLEPATASVVHSGLGLSSHCMLFDVSNACLGFLNGFIIIANMIEAGQIKNGLVVSSESGGPLVEQTIKRILEDKNLTRNTFKNSFASLTIGSGAVACIVSRKDYSQKGFQLIGATAKAATKWVDLCQGDASSDTAPSSGFDGASLPDMQTDSEKMLHAGCELALENWLELKSFLNWQNNTPEHFICHQVGKAHQNLLFQKLEIDQQKDHPTYQKYGNTGSAALPMALADCELSGKIKSGDKLALLGIGSGLNSVMVGVEYLG
jgi:3-oxoacyl-[acyl-carrier-protein] synthase III